MAVAAPPARGRDYGEALARRGSAAARARMLEVLREGADVSHRLGMTPTSARIDEALRKAQEGPLRATSRTSSRRRA